MSDRIKKGQRGGRRDGAGAKRKLDKKVRVSMRVLPWVLDLMQKKADENLETLSAFGGRVLTDAVVDCGAPSYIKNADARKSKPPVQTNEL